MDEIEKVTSIERAWNGKRVQSTDEQIFAILTPMFAMFPQTKADKHTVSMYVMMLRDIAPDVLEAAVLKAIASCKFLPSVAEIREQIETRIPGPSSEIDWSKRKPVPQNMYHLDPEEDKRQRMARLARTKGWKYA